MTDRNKVHTFKIAAAQGDLLMRRISAIPAGLKKVEKFDGIVAHSETGHHHKFDSVEGMTAYQTGDEALMYLLLDKPAQLTHHRLSDTHEPFLFDAGCYALHRPREYTSAREKARLVQD